jgi:indolepyruvate ferredoxin oxidoreductase alpha subunit
MERIAEAGSGVRILALGNEAIVRGALEYGVDVATTYPGTPSSEIGDIFSRIAHKLGIYFEYSTNEKVALELGIGASISGLNSLTFMKHVGLNVASDALTSLAYIGVRGAHVIVSADDPGSHSSQNEQDNRWYAKLANIPMLEPSSPQETKDMVVYAFSLSKELEIPVLLRTTTRVSHTRAPILLVCKMESAMKVSESSPYNFVLNGDSPSRLGIVASGVSYAYAMDVLKKLKLNAKVLKLGMTNPIPKRLCAEFLKGVDDVIILEELDPYLESEIRSIAGENKIHVNIYGKETGHFPRTNEYTPDTVEIGIVKAIKENLPGTEFRSPEIKMAQIPPLKLPSRPPVLCPGCPHRSTAYAAKKASGKGTIYPMDIGCYTLVFEPPLNMADVVLCMGSSVGTACGFSQATDQNIIAFMGDSTFFHAGIPGLINAVHQGHNFVLTIMDNRTTAMTGFQPHPGVNIKDGGEAAKAVDILEVVKGCGVDSVNLVDPYDLSKTIVAFYDALAFKGLSVVIAQHPCALVETKERKMKGERIAPYTINKGTCIKCYTCTSEFGCPASWKGEDEFPVISPTLCIGCGACAPVCPTDSIKPINDLEEGM